MKLFTKITMLSTVAALAIGLSGCSQDAVSEGDSTANNSVTVERGPIIGALVVDAKMQVALDKGEGHYEFKNTPEYPLQATGGYIDVNRNGKIEAGEVKNTLVLKLKEKGKAMTLVTTLASDPEMLSYLETEFGLTKEEILNNLPGNSKAIEAISNKLYEIAITEGEMDLTKAQIKKQVKAKAAEIKSAVEEYKTDKREPKEREEALMQNLNNVPTIDADEVEAIKVKLQTRVEEQKEGVKADYLAYVNDMELTADQKAALDSIYQLNAVSADLIALSELTQEQKDHAAEQSEKVQDKLDALYSKLGLSVPTVSDLATLAASDAELAALVSTLSTSTDLETEKEALKDYLETRMQSLKDSLPISMKVAFEAEAQQGDMEGLATEMEAEHDAQHDEAHTSASETEHDLQEGAQSSVPTM